VQLGFVAGACASSLLNLPDVVAAAATGAIAVFATGPASATALRFLTGMALAGVYPVGMKLASSWYARGRGLALGILVAAP